MTSSALTCNIKAISVLQRPRYNHLVSRLRSAMRDRTELPDGYEYLLDSAQITQLELSEWMVMERQCCPFLIFQLEGARGDWRLAMRGPDGSKAILMAEFPAGGPEARPECSTGGQEAGGRENG